MPPPIRLILLLFISFILGTSSLVAMPQIQKIGERAQYEVYIDKSTIRKFGSNIEYISIYKFKNPYEYERLKYYDRVYVHYRVNCESKASGEQLPAKSAKLIPFFLIKVHTYSLFNLNHN
jgi:hypothetical protein